MFYLPNNKQNKLNSKSKTKIMKTGICVRVKSQNSKHYNKKGIAINAAPRFTAVRLFDTKEVVVFPNRMLEQSTHVSRPNIESEVLKHVGEKIERIKQHAQSLEKKTELAMSHASKYQPDWAKATVKVLEDELKDKREIMQMLHNLLQGK
jgi:ATP-dependent Lon protease